MQDRTRLEPDESGGSNGLLETLHRPSIEQEDNIQPRLSTSSSGLVHTMKTASLSNIGSSFFHRSGRWTRDSDIGGHYASRSRFSSESERPTTASSIDEAAARRSGRRRQIITELTLTEESYISDLKALVYLHSTLLTSTIALPNHLRSSIQRNILEILHLHEHLLDRLHRASLKAAARKWADTVSLSRLENTSHRRWQSLDSTMLNHSRRNRGHTIGSSESPGRVKRQSFQATADPSDVADVVDIFQSCLKQFYIYEEYCANRNGIEDEFHKHSPTARSTYESGMESLTRSVVALDRRMDYSRKGVTVNDLLIKPVQRVCRYLLLLEDLLRQTPVADCPDTHAALATVIVGLRDVVQVMDFASGSHEAQRQIQRRRLLQSKLNFDRISIRPNQLRSLGHVKLCGVLHIAFQTRFRVNGSYALCILFTSHFMVAVPAGATGRFDILACIDLNDLRLESSGNGIGLQCHSALHTWKICFAAGESLHEMIFSASSTVEEQAWLAGLANRPSRTQCPADYAMSIPTVIGIDFKSFTLHPISFEDTPRLCSVQRAATVGGRHGICQIIVRDTHNPEEIQQLRQNPSPLPINRSRSHNTATNIVVLAPKRSERVRLEAILGDVWTKDRLPYPGMTSSRSGQIIRASAGTLVRKLSFASIQAPFSRRSSNHTASTGTMKSSSDDNKLRREPRASPTFQILRHSNERLHTPSKVSPDVPELDSMNRVIERMIRGHLHQPSSTVGQSSITWAPTPAKQVRSIPLELEDSAEPFYIEAQRDEELGGLIEDKLVGKKKRWSNPIGLLKNFSAESIKSMLHSGH